jgi:hypothetical protein
VLPHHDIHPRDDGMFDVVSGDAIAGPFPTLAFAAAVAGAAPERKPAAKFRRFWRIVREACNDAS